MKSTGMVRKVDELGRIVIPKELRKTLGIIEGIPVAFYTENEEIILKKYEPSCVFCGESRNVTEYKGKRICNECLEQLQNSK